MVPVGMNRRLAREQRLVCISAFYVGIFLTKLVHTAACCAAWITAL